MLVSNQVSAIATPPTKTATIFPAPKAYSYGGLTIPWWRRRIEPIADSVDALTFDVGEFNWKGLILGILVGAGAFWAIQKFLIK